MHIISYLSLVPENHFHDQNDILNLHKFHQCLQGSAVKLVLHCTKQTTLVKSRDLELRHLEPTTWWSCFDKQKILINNKKAEKKTDVKDQWQL